MEQRNRQQQAADLASKMSRLPPDQVTRMGLVLLISTSVSLVLQCLLLLTGINTARQLHKARHNGFRHLAHVAANPQLLVLTIASVAHWVLSTAWLSQWIRRVQNTNPH